MVRQTSAPSTWESAWATENRLALGQVKVSEKSNEITAIPELLRALALTGCIVTLDAMGCQRKIAEQIIDGEADYVLALKDNQGTLHQDVADYFTWAEKTGFKQIPHTFAETLEKDHGRIRAAAVLLRRMTLSGCSRKQHGRVCNQS